MVGVSVGIYFTWDGGDDIVLTDDGGQSNIAIGGIRSGCVEMILTHYSDCLLEHFP